MIEILPAEPTVIEIGAVGAVAEVIMPAEVAQIEVGSMAVQDIAVRISSTSAPRAGFAQVGYATLKERDADVVINMPPMA